MALRAVQKGEFPPPRRLDSAIDPALEAVCLKAMALRAEDRYPTPRALAEDIEHWMADEPVAAWREPWARRARRWGRRHRTAMMAAASSLLVALAGMLSVLVVQARANSELTQSNNALAAANERERARFVLAMDAVKLFHGEVSEDFLLKEKPFAALRTKLLRGAADFYGKLESLLAGQTDRPSRVALARAYHRGSGGNRWLRPASPGRSGPGPPSDGETTAADGHTGRGAGRVRAGAGDPAKTCRRLPRSRPVPV
jgi:hypothetical protein